MLANFIDQQTPSEARRELRRGLIVGGIAFTVLGAIALIAPAAVGLAVNLVIGWILLLIGGLQIATALWRRRRQAWRTGLIGALLAIVGLVLVLEPVTGAFVLTLLVAITLLVDGAFGLWAAGQVRGRPTAPVLAISGGLSVLLGVIMLLVLPQAALWLLGLLVGFAFLADGIGSLLIAARMRPPTA